jgi:mRNA-degrading endonuclease RelE of RelBE toxin-antitoxin system
MILPRGMGWMYDLDIKPTADKIFKKMVKKNRKRLEIIHKKIQEIRKDPEHDYKHLRKPLQHFYGVHINAHFVLIFAINHFDEVVEIFYFGHHDDVYSWSPSRSNK